MVWSRRKGRLRPWVPGVVATPQLRGRPFILFSAGCCGAREEHSPCLARQSDHWGSGNLAVPNTHGRAEDRNLDAIVISGVTGLDPTRFALNWIDSHRTVLHSSIVTSDAPGDNAVAFRRSKVVMNACTSSGLSTSNDPVICSSQATYRPRRGSRTMQGADTANGAPVGSTCRRMCGWLVTTSTKWASCSTSSRGSGRAPRTRLRTLPASGIRGRGARRRACDWPQAAWVAWCSLVM
jgi:hypothetical protein